MSKCIMKKGPNPQVSFFKVVSEVFHGSDLKVSGFQTEEIFSVTKISKCFVQKLPEGRSNEEVERVPIIFYAAETIDRSSA